MASENLQGGQGKLLSNHRIVTEPDATYNLKRMMKKSRG